MMDITAVDIKDPKLNGYRTQWKDLKSRIDPLVADAREAAETIKTAKRDYLIGKQAGKTDLDKGQESLRGRIGVAQARLRELLDNGEALRTEGFSLGKQLRQIENDKRDEEMRLRTVLYEKQVAGQIAESVNAAAGAAPQEISRLLTA